jgi:hypothetical protein
MYSMGKLAFISVISLVIFLLSISSCASVPASASASASAVAAVPVSNVSQTNEEHYTITVLAYTGGTLVDDKGTKSIAGHASISINRTGVWGFYPGTPGKLVTRRGLLKYSAEYPRTQEYADFIVDAAVMDKISELLLQWENDTPCFVIPFNDCVSFIYRVCDIIGLKYNSLILLPIDAIRYIGRRNDQYHIYKAAVE